MVSTWSMDDKCVWEGWHGWVAMHIIVEQWITYAWSLSMNNKNGDGSKAWKFIYMPLKENILKSSSDGLFSCALKFMDHVSISLLLCFHSSLLFFSFIPATGQHCSHILSWEKEREREREKDDRPLFIQIMWNC